MKEKINNLIKEYERMIEHCFNYLQQSLKKNLPLYEKMARIDYYRDLIYSYNAILSELYVLLDYCKEGVN